MNHWPLEPKNSEQELTWTRSALGTLPSCGSEWQCWRPICCRSDSAGKQKEGPTCLCLLPAPADEAAPPCLPRLVPPHSASLWRSRYPNIVIPFFSRFQGSQGSQGSSFLFLVTMVKRENNCVLKVRTGTPYVDCPYFSSFLIWHFFLKSPFFSRVEFCSQISQATVDMSLTRAVRKLFTRGW